MPGAQTGAPGARPKFKTSFKATKTYEPVHTGGKVTLSGDGKWLVSTLNDQALVTQLDTGERIKQLKGDTSEVSTLALTPTPPSPLDGGFLLTCNKSLALQLYSLPSLELHRTIAKAHDAPIITCGADPTGTLFATGSADGVVKVWDAQHAHCTHVFKGHGGIISALVFDIGKDGQRARLVSGADDCRIRVWDLRSRECLHVLEGHVSVVRGLDVTQDGKLLVSGGRDKVVNVWDLDRGVLRKTMPVFETLETVGLVDVPAQQDFDGVGKGKAKEGPTRRAVYTGGDKGVIRLWDLATGQEISTADKHEHGKLHEITDVIHTPGTLTSVHVDLNIIVRSLPDLSIAQQVIGFNDEVIDLTYLTSPNEQEGGKEDEDVVSERKESHLAVATNSDLIRIYNLSRYHVDLLAGHHDVALSLARSTRGDVLVSGSKDKTARVWQQRRAREGSGARRWECTGVAHGHVESVGAVAVSKKETNFFVTASQDRTAKVWDLAGVLSPGALEADEPHVAVKALTTLKIHDKDINALDIAPNDKLLASGSQDRTAKLFSVQYTAKTKSSPASAQMTLLGTFKGHKRGVWTVKFSPTDQCLATGSGDRTIKLWNLTDFTCIKTFEGHSNSVLRVDFLTRGMQLSSCGSDGLVKVWNVKDENCVATLDNHEDKIWGLTISKDESQIVSGGADSVITVWQDVTEEQELEKIAEREEQVLMEQDFENFVQIKDYTNAIRLALTMNQPKRLLRLLTEVRHASPEMTLSFTGSINVDSVIKSLSTVDLRQLLMYIKDWNTVARTAEVAQGVLHAVFKFHSVEQVLEALEPPKPLEEEQDEDEEDESGDDEDDAMNGRQGRGRRPKRKPVEMKAGELLQALIPYTERHMNRADKLVRESFIVEHLLSQMVGFEDFDGDGDVEMQEDRVGR
ncbi:hypothetical protein ACM66B_000074 [Microbotryomycetes sp. NB124-2]